LRSHYLTLLSMVAVAALAAAFFGGVFLVGFPSDQVAFPSIKCATLCPSEGANRAWLFEPYLLYDDELSESQFEGNELWPPPKYKTRADVIVPASSRDEHERRQVVRSFVHQQIPINLNAWKTEVNTAIDLAAPPAKPESRVFWFVALAGNLVWAAVCLIAPPAAAGIAAAEIAVGEAAERFMTQKEIAKQLASEIRTNIAKTAKDNADAVRSVVTKTMNFGGAAVGSNILTPKAKENPGAEDGKAMVRDIIGKSRANLEDDYKKSMRDVWTEQLIQIWKTAGDIEPLDLFDLFLWAQMFPRIPYDEDRFNAVRKSAQSVIESALADYNRQWVKYQTDRMMPRYNQAYALWAMGTLAILGPFNPKLLFKID
jgi:hypothetical protein